MPVSPGVIVCAFTRSVGWLDFWFGVVVGLGNGFGYATPIPVTAEWFPDRCGLAVGLAVAGYGGGSAVFGPLRKGYLARYTHKAAISNHRLVDRSDGRVSFRWKDDAHGSRQGTMALDAVEFVPRFLTRVFPTDFVRVRHYGLLVNRHRREKLARCRDLLGVTPQAHRKPTDPIPPMGHEAVVTPTRVCPRCGAGRMVVVAEFPPMPPAVGITAGLAPRPILDNS